ncbi:MAG: hypothetical protein WAO76_00515 [Georgfuchsia sp.]
MKTDQIIERLFSIVEKLIDKQPVVDNSRVAEVERRLDEIDAVWPKMKGDEQ